MKKIISMVIMLAILLSYVLSIGTVYATIETQYNYLTKGAFETAEGAPGIGAFSGNGYGGWRINTAPVNITASPTAMNSGNALELVATSGGTAPRIDHQNIGLSDVVSGAVYTDTRVFETDFVVTGSTAPQVQIFSKFLYLKNNGTSDFYLSADMPSGIKIIKKITLADKHHVKMVYKVSSNQAAPGNAAMLAIYVDGIRIINDTSGIPLFSTGGFPINMWSNYFKDTTAAPNNTNNGLTYNSGLAFNVLITPTSGIPAGQDTRLYLDNVQYYGVVLPTVTTSYPLSTPKNTAVLTDSTLSVTFSTAMDSTTMNSSNIVLAKKSNGAVHSCVGSYDVSSKTYSIDLEQTPLIQGTDYILTVKDAVTDANGNAMVSYPIEFTTAGIPAYQFPSTYNYLAQSAFESTETGAPALGAFASNWYAYGGWRSMTSNINVVATSPIGTGRALELIATNTSASRMQCQNTGLLDVVPVGTGAVYTNTRVFETDFRVSGSKTATVQLFGQFLYLRDNGDNNLYLKTDTRPSGSKFIQKIELDTNYNVKMVYKVSSNQTAPGDSVVLAIYLNGVKLINDKDGNTLIPQGGLPVGMSNNYFKDTTASATNNGLSYTAATGFNIWILNNTNIPVNENTTLYVDNVKYYGVPSLQITNVNPVSTAVNQKLNDIISVSFNNDMNTDMLNSDSIIIREKTTPANVVNYKAGSYNSSTKSYEINLAFTPLKPSTEYELVVNNTVADLSGQTLASSNISSFTTGTVISPKFVAMLEKNSTYIDKIVAGTLNANVAVTGTDETFNIVLAIYKQVNGNSTLQDIRISEQTIVGYKLNNLTFENCIIPVADANEKYSIKIFKWKTVDGLLPQSTIISY